MFDAEFKLASITRMVSTTSEQNVPALTTEQEFCELQAKGGFLFRDGGKCIAVQAAYRDAGVEMPRRKSNIPDMEYPPKHKAV